MEDHGNEYKDSSTTFISGEMPPLPPEFDAIIKKLDKERETLYNKDKGLYKKSFFIIWPSVIAITTILVFIFSGDTAIIFGVGGFLGAFISAIAAFVYKLLTKAKSAEIFMPKLKKELVSKILHEVNPNLAFSEIGIKEENFFNSELFNGQNFKSEDSITGVVNGQHISISECKVSHKHKRGEKSSSAHISEFTDNAFNGMFIQMKLNSINLQTPIKIIPSFAVSTNFTTARNLNPLSKGEIINKRIKISLEEHIPIDPSIKKSNYHFFCKSKKEVDSFVNESRLKVLDFIFDKYENERAVLFEDTALLRNINQSTGLYISIIGNTLNLALDWNEDLFEADVFLKEGIEETGLAQKIHRDLLFINQIINEVSLIDKANG